MRHPRRYILLGAAVCALVAGDRRVSSAQDEGIPECSVDLNHETVWEVPVDEASYRSEIRPVIERFGLEHARAFLRYTLPVSAVWAVTGLKQLAGGGDLTACCEGCNNVCADDVIFTKRQQGSVAAEFTILLRNVNGSVWQRTFTRPGYEARLSVPTSLRGLVVVAPGRVEVFFSDPPELYIKAGLEDVFQGRARCSASLNQWALLRNIDYEGRPPAIHLFLKPTP